jgi:hypothetical protein
MAIINNKYTLYVIPPHPPLAKSVRLETEGGIGGVETHLLCQICWVQNMNFF